MVSGLAVQLLTVVTNRISSASNISGATRVIEIDISKTFDRFSHRFLVGSSAISFLISVIDGVMYMIIYLCIYLGDYREVKKKCNWIDINKTKMVSMVIFAVKIVIDVKIKTVSSNEFNPGYAKNALMPTVH